MIPDQISPVVRSNAERQIFRWLSQIDGSDWAAALHSVNLSEHRWKTMGEIDFLLVGPRGIFVLEVKGGRVARSSGVWEFTDRHGNTRKRREGPFKQAEGAMFSLRDRLDELMPGELSRTTFGYAVIIPDADLAIKTVEWDEAMVMDRSQLDRSDGLRRGLGTTASYWMDKPGRGVRMSESLIDRVIDVLRPDFETVVPLRTLARAIEDEVVRLTVDQFRALDAMSVSPRVLFEGGAGTGKTLLAVEACRRAAAQGLSVLYTCSSPHIAAHVGADPDLTSVDVATLDRLSSCASELYDLIVVDEAQDIISFRDLGMLDAVVRGSLDDGRWMMFLDSNNQRGLVGTYDEEAMQYLMAQRPAVYVLNDNCRNTREIVSDTQRLTGADLGVSSAGSGPEVQFIQALDPGSGAQQVAAALAELRDQSIEMSDVVLLSDRPFAESSFARLPAKWRLLVDHLDLSSAAPRPPGRIGFSTTAQFKGLESAFAIVECSAGPGSPLARPSLYVGMTRARVGLWVLQLLDHDGGSDDA